MIQYPQIDPVALSLGPISIYWYGLTYVGGLMFAWWLGRQRSRVAGSPISETEVDDLIFYAALGIIAGVDELAMRCFMVRHHCLKIQ